MGDEILLTDEALPPMQEELFRLYSQGFLTDITLSCEDGKNFEAHRVLLAARSQYFYGIVPKLKVEPVIFLKGVKGSHLEKVLKYIYSGSASVPKSQLRPILEVAKSLQVKGLQDLALTELSRGTNTGGVTAPSSSKYGGSSGSKTSSPVPPKKDSDSVFRSSPSSQNARDIALQQQQKLYDKLSSNSINSVKKTPSKHSKGHGERSMTYTTSSPNSKRGRPTAKNFSKSLKSEENGEETFKFQYQYISDDSDEIDKDDSNDSDFELAAKRNQLLASKVSPSKKKRGRPPKSNESSLGSKKDFNKDYSDGSDNVGNASKSSSDDDSDNSSDDDDDDLDNDRDNDSSDSDSDNESDDNSDDQEEMSNKASKSTSPRRSSGPVTSLKKAKMSDLKLESKIKKESCVSRPNTSESQDTPNQGVRRGGRGPTINGKHMLAVQCKGKRAELHLSKFGNGTSGKSIKYKGEWMTPEDYEQACGSKTKKYLESVTTDYGPLKTLTQSGLLKPHPKKCKCNICMDEPFTSPEGPKRPKKEEYVDTRKEISQELAMKKTENDTIKVSKRESSASNDNMETDADGRVNLKRKRQQDNTTEKEEVKQKLQPTTQAQPLNKPTVPTTTTTTTNTAGGSKISVAPKPTNSVKELVSNAKPTTEKTSESTMPVTKPIVTTTPSPSKVSSLTTKTEIISPPTLTTTKPIISSPVTCSANISSSSTFPLPPLTSSNSTKPLASPSFIAMTPATSLNSLPSIQTSSVVPFPSKLSGIPSPCLPSATTIVATFTSPALTTISSVLPTTTTTSSNFAQLKVETSQNNHTTQSPSLQQIKPAQHHHQQPHQHQQQQLQQQQQTSRQVKPVDLGQPSSQHQQVPVPHHQAQLIHSQQVQQQGQLQSHQQGQHQQLLQQQHSQQQPLAPPSQQQTQQLQMQQLAGQMKQNQGGRVGAVMQVRCKSISALLYVNKYESGSKGKCILVGEDWMTPNEYEEKSGSKAKKYLSSIKCLGRPLRAYVNSGELRGSGPPPSPKPSKLNKPKAPPLIAPAPTPGQSGTTASGLASLSAQLSGHHGASGHPGMTPGGHMQAASLAQGGIMMSGVSVAGQPIILNQGNHIGQVASSMASAVQQQAPILAPMTFTFAPMSAMGNLGGQQMQGQQLHGQQLHSGGAVQQMHSATDYIIQHK